MEIATYWVGEVPRDPLRITVYNDDGTLLDLSGYDTARLLMRGAHNRTIDTTANGGRAEISNLTASEVSYYWPTKSLFTQPGDYQVQVELSGPTSKVYTRIHTLVVKQPIGG